MMAAAAVNLSTWYSFDDNVVLGQRCGIKQQHLHAVRNFGRVQ